MNNYSKYKDEELILLLREPKPACDIAFNEIYLRHSKHLYAYCLYKLKNIERAKDIFQDTWVNFHKRCQSNEPIQRLRPYLLTIARNLIIKDWIENKTEDLLLINVEGITSNVFLGEMNFSQTQDDKELLSHVINTVNGLEDIYREVYVLKIFEDLSYTEIAKLTGEPIKTIQSRFYKASNILNEILLPYIKEFNK
ncbi:MAG: sigma-70 family RNA polymerase sigma factor [FCB group bacterium]|jgi:RNA polymerase sigma-70 factor (ECF subfamily)